jgi:hypothetical protein
MTFYSRELKMPHTRLDGLCNFVQMVINALEAGNTESALLTAVDLLDTLRGQSNPFSSITSEKDNAMLAELKRQHAAEVSEAIIRAHADGFAKGEQAHKLKMVELLGLAA